jgi:hypothetical protein
MDMRIINEVGDKKFGCAICFERLKIKEKVLVCNAPCNKIFHQDCFYKSVEGIYLCDIKCCYCRRILIQDSDLNDSRNTFVNHTLYKMYKMRLCYIHEQIDPRFLLLDNPVRKAEHIKKPKQSKRSFYK